MLIGRDDELARIEQLLARARLGTSEVIVISGEPGIGKTALLRRAVEQAHGMTILQAKGVESEAEIPFAGLYALLRPAFDRLDDLPEPQAAALKGALGLAPGSESDRFLIGAATLSLLASLAESRPVLIAIDDGQWVDESSLSAVLFAARRLFADALALILATRPSLTLELPTLELGGLDRATAAVVIEHHAGAPLPPGIADRLFDATLGSPASVRASSPRSRSGWPSSTPAAATRAPAGCARPPICSSAPTRSRTIRACWPSPRKGRSGSGRRRAAAC